MEYLLVLIPILLVGLVFEVQKRRGRTFVRKPLFTNQSESRQSYLSEQAWNIVVVVVLILLLIAFVR